MGTGDSTRFSINFNDCMYSEITLLGLACKLIYAVSDTLPVVPQLGVIHFYSEM